MLALFESPHLHILHWKARLLYFSAFSFFLGQIPKSSNCSTRKEGLPSNIWMYHWIYISLAGLQKPEKWLVSRLLTSWLFRDPFAGSEDSVCFKDLFIASDFTDFIVLFRTSTSLWKGMTRIASFRPSEIIFRLVQIVVKWTEEIIPRYASTYEVLHGFVRGLVISLLQFTCVFFRLNFLYILCNDK